MLLSKYKIIPTTITFMSFMLMALLEELSLFYVPCQVKILGNQSCVPSKEETLFGQSLLCHCRDICQMVRHIIHACTSKHWPAITTVPCCAVFTTTDTSAVVWPGVGMICSKSSILYGSPGWRLWRNHSVSKHMPFNSNSKMKKIKKDTHLLR